ncbi:DUF2141 domain-containing protein [Novosphingobium sp. FGD1]|jgi:uncharacterized protein (DUF2141 family)|uniref:DUF2141 domain-containing protein n=1 Tax=Novosphingobium silvae TaxID=2692619 RepID=A0A7X4GFR6_9SPHN|nr:DUF2141 domain-containing protein [Novosphingobium silvae]MYL96704.1 DUF2141 domain-containing protein [Novosphingobium silvae]
MAAPAAAAPAQTGVQVTVTQLRSAKGQVLACLTARADAFPDCHKDPLARKLTIPAAEQVVLDFGAVPQGRYAVSVIHDENANGKLDTRLIIPREGYGFSRDAAVRMGPPSFDRAAVSVEGEAVRLTIRMRYLL